MEIPKATRDWLKKELGKEDWQKGLKAAESSIKNSAILLIQDSILMDLCKEKLAEFPDEAEEAEAEIKEAANDDTPKAG